MTLGRKDFLDLLALFKTDSINLNNILQILKIFNMQKCVTIFKDFLNENYEVVELELNKHAYSKLKKKILT